jgi:aspartate racemase
MKTIGILGGLGPESTMACYAYITRKHFEIEGNYAYPEIVLYSCSFEKFIPAGYELPDTVKAAIGALHRAGADFVVAPCNSVHIVYEQVANDIPIPWVSIMDAAAARIRQAGLRKVALLGTIFTMSKGFYQRGMARHGIETVTPGPEGQEKVNRIIFDELITNRPTDASRQLVLGLVEELRNRGAQGLVLGCTELPFLIGQEHTDLPVFDTSELLAQKALDLARGIETPV